MNNNSFRNKMYHSNMVSVSQDKNVVPHFENMQLYRSRIEKLEDLLSPHIYSAEIATTFCLLSIASLVDHLKRLSKRLQSITFYFNIKKKNRYFHTYKDFAYSKSFSSSSSFSIVFIVLVIS